MCIKKIEDFEISKNEHLRQERLEETERLRLLLDQIYLRIFRLVQLDLLHAYVSNKLDDWFEQMTDRSYNE
jgi:hypothetical protein